MHRTPMPSPLGTNYANLFIESPPTAAYDGKYGIEDPPRRAAKWGADATRRALRAAGLAPDTSADPEPTQGTNANAATIDKMIAHGSKNFSADDWLDFRAKAKDAHQS